MARGWTTSVKRGWFGGFIATAHINGHSPISLKRASEEEAHRAISEAIAKEERVWRKYSPDGNRVRGHWI